MTKPGELNTFHDRLGSDTENDSEVIESGSSEKTTTFYSINPCKNYKNSSFYSVRSRREVLCKIAFVGG